MKETKQLLPNKITLFALLVALFTAACMDDNFSTNPAHLLTLSTDTIQFDTIFTTIGTATQQTKVYNKNNQDLLLTSVRLAGGGDSPFYINVDGRSGTSFSNLEIAASDSLYLFIGANIDPLDEDNPILVYDSIVFNTAYNQQVIHLVAYGQDVVIYRNYEITADTTFTANRPYLVYDTLTVAANVTLTVEAGATIHFHDLATLQVHGTLLANGTLGNQIALRGDRLDNLFDNLPYDDLAGQWDGVRFYDTSFGNVLSHTYMRGSTNGITIDSTSYTPTKLTIANSIIHNASNNLVTSINASLDIYNSQLSNAGGAVLLLIGGTATIVHCTIANYYNYDYISSPILMMQNYLSDLSTGITTSYPMSVALYNTIIYGTPTDVQLNNYEDGSIQFDHLFDHCLLKSDGEDDEQFISTLWASDPQFRTTGEEYVFDYRLDSLSVARNAGNAEVAQIAPFDVDMLGNSRTINAQPDLGAYQWVGEASETVQ